MRSSRTAIVALAAAVAAGAAWPWLFAPRAQATAAATAPVNDDYRLRDRTVAFYERQVRDDAHDQVALRTLGSQYLSRFRETGEFGDVARARSAAQRSLGLQPQGNVQALAVLASADLAYHDFHAALAADDAAVEAEPFDDEARAQSASVLMELGRYSEADRILLHPASADPNPTWMSVRARYDELTGNLAGARAGIARAEAMIDRMIAVPAFTRSWYHLRAGQLAFEAGDDDAAANEYGEALRIFPGNAAALMFQAKLDLARGDWTAALDAATRSADLYPLPQALGYEADAQTALGDSAAARRTDELIRAEQRLYNVSGVNDRLLALYYADHQEHLDDALRAAQSDLAKRGDEIYADDTMAWVLAAMGRWNYAASYERRALRFGIQDPDVRRHAVLIASHATLRVPRGQ